MAQKGPPHLDFVALGDNIFVSCIQVVGDEMKAKKVLNDALEIDPVSKSVFFSIEQPGPGCSKLTTSLVNVPLKFQM